MASVLDTGPVNVRGALQARNARVIWADGVLHVVARNGQGFTVQTLETSEPVPPQQHRGYWRADSDEGTVSFTRRGCPTCGGGYTPLRSLARQDIIDGNV